MDGKQDSEGGLKKREDGKLDVRPIAIPESLYRICALCALEETKGAISAKLAEVQQLSVGIPCAAEGIATALRLFLEVPLDVQSDPEASADAAEPLVRLVVNADASIAFNTVDRSAILEGVAEVAPSLLPLVRCIYNRAGRLVFANSGPGAERFRVFLSLTGARQGDPLGPVLYALGVLGAMRKVLATHPGLLAPSYVDDVNLAIEARGAAAASAAASAAFSSLQAEMGAVGIQYNLTKTHVYCPTPGVTIATTPPLRQQPAGTTTLGVPMGGSEFVLAKLRKRMAPSLAQLALLPQLDFGIAMLILRKSIAPRMDYLAATLSGEVALPAFQEWRAAVRKCLTTMFKSEPPARCFPSGPGCLGITDICDKMALARVNGWARSARLIRAHLPAVAPLTAITTGSAHPVHREVLAAWDALPPSVQAAGTSPASPDATNSVLPTFTDKLAADARRKLSEAHSTFLRKQVYASLDDRGKLLMLAASTPGARAWLDAVPTFDDVSLSDTQARFATNIWLGAPIPELQDERDPLGRAVMRQGGSAQIARHRGLQLAVAHIQADAGCQVWLEPPHMFPRSLRRVDTAARDTATSVQDLVDVSVRDTATDAILSRTRALYEPLRAVLEGEAEKKATYSDVPHGWTFIPLIMGTQGEVGPAGAEFISDLARRVAQRRNGGSEPPARLVNQQLRAVRERLACAVARGMGEQIIAFLDAKEPAGLRDATRFVPFQERGAEGGRAAGAQRLTSR